MASKYIKLELSICSKNCPDFLVKMNYLSAPGIFPPGSTTKIGTFFKTVCEDEDAAMRHAATAAGSAHKKKRPTL